MPTPENLMVQKLEQMDNSISKLTQKMVEA